MKEEPPENREKLKPRILLHWPNTLAPMLAEYHARVRETDSTELRNTV